MNIKIVQLKHLEPVLQDSQNNVLAEHEIHNTTKQLEPRLCIYQRFNGKLV